MKKLHADWFIEGTLDFEYKKYMLLAYLQYVSREFAELKLYPPLADLINHYQALIAFRSKQEELISRFPQAFYTDENQNLHFRHDGFMNEEEKLKTVNEIIEFALPEIKDNLEEGKELYDYIEEKINIEPIGIIPLYKSEGYLLLSIENSKTVKAFEYQIIFFENTGANYHGISMGYITSFAKSIVNTYESMKHQLIRGHKKYPNPATFLIYSPISVPEEASLLPISKRKFLAYMK